MSVADQTRVLGKVKIAACNWRLKLITNKRITNNDWTVEPART